MHIKTFLIVGIMSFLSTLLGCSKKPSPTTGPDFDNLTTTTVIHFDPGQRVEYEFPGNLSKDFGFDAAREREEQTKNISTSSLSAEDFELRTWREEKFIDAGRWDYLGPWRQGLGGELGWLKVGLDLNRRRFADLSESTFGQEIKSDFSEYIEKQNDEVRAHYQGYSEDNLKGFLTPISDDFEWITLSGTRMLKWSSQEDKVSPLTYYALPIDQNHFLTITINYHTSVNDDKLYENLVQRIQNDIGKIMDLFVISASDT